eukprot:2041962-Amphidinium_carterae.1
MFEAYVIPCYPRNAEHRSWRKGRHYDPPEVLRSPNLVGNLALCSKRELAWATSRQKIRSTPEPVTKYLEFMGDAFNEISLIGHLPDFFLQTSGSLRDARGNPIPAGRAGGKQWEKSLHALLYEVNQGKVGAEALQWRVTAVAREADFAEQTAIWMQMIGQIILPTLIDNRTVRYEINKLGT